jgi:hypothetical protein
MEPFYRFVHISLSPGEARRVGQFFSYTRGGLKAPAVYMGGLCSPKSNGKKDHGHEKQTLYGVFWFSFTFCPVVRSL